MKIIGNCSPEGEREKHLYNRRLRLREKGGGVCKSNFPERAIISNLRWAINIDRNRKWPVGWALNSPAFLVAGTGLGIPGCAITRQQVVLTQPRPQLTSSLSTVSLPSHRPHDYHFVLFSSHTFCCLHLNISPISPHPSW